MIRVIIIRILTAYKRLLSPLLLPACRYVPSCSEYAMESIERHGAICGGMKAIWRLARCHPFAKGGYDPAEPSAAEPTIGATHHNRAAHGFIKW